MREYLDRASEEVLAIGTIEHIDALHTTAEVLSSPGLDLAFLGPGRAAVMSQHAFAVYPLATQARGARSIVVPATDYGHDLEAMVQGGQIGQATYRRLREMVLRSPHIVSCR